MSMSGSKRLRGVLSSQSDVAETFDNDHEDEDDDDETQPPDSLDANIESQQQDDNDNEEYDVIEIRGQEGNVRKKLTRAKDVWTLPKGSKVIVQFNNFGQPIKKSGGILGGWLGNVARKKEFCSVEYSNWRKMPREHKDNLWKLTKAYFEISDNPQIQKWVLSSIRVKWKNYKHELKCKHFLPGKTQQQVIDSVPQEISPFQWKKLVEYWFSEESQTRSDKGKAAREHHKTPHTCGSKSFARRKDEYIVKNGKEPGRVDFFAITRKKKDGTFVNPEAKTVVDTATNLIIERSATFENQDASIVQNEIFCEVMGEDQYGRVKGYGLGVTPTQINGQVFPYKEKRSSDMESMQKALGDMQENYEKKIEDLTTCYEDKVGQLKEEYEKSKKDMQIVNDQLLSDMHRLQREFVQFKDMMSQNMPDFSESGT